MTDRIEDDYRARFGGGFVVPRIRLLMEMLKAAIVKAGSTDADRVAAAMAGAQQKTMYGGIATMRPADHQVLQDLYVASFGPRAASMHFDQEHTGRGWKTAGMVQAAAPPRPTPRRTPK